MYVGLEELGELNWSIHTDKLEMLSIPQLSVMGTVEYLLLAVSDGHLGSTCYKPSRIGAAEYPLLADIDGHCRVPAISCQ